MKPMLYISYIPLLTDAKGILKEPSEKERILSMLHEASTEYPIRYIAWVMESFGRAYPVLIIPRGGDIANHALEWSEGRTEKYFTLVYRTLEGGGYAVALYPDFDKSARRYRSKYGKPNDLMTIVGHIFTYWVDKSDADLKTFLQGKQRTKLGLSDQLPVVGSQVIENYHEIQVACKSYEMLDREDREVLAPYLNPLPN